ncbi:adenylate isopentenyltransferase 5, chloroplastic-like [Amaranthus tricolor]|uniref:adenylate isopentenyltransferase 5, chloroplastic-like n=1 Tax=Amaranthus tricolor TaxID=29722 RepID=UPI00258DC28A|nr:adenylate isopentenyltransferase 5, chloroplastic-like [Amaranthus tricolor]
MNISSSFGETCAKSLINYHNELNASFNIHIYNNNHIYKDKVIFVMGATGTGKSKLSIDIANHIPAEIINCDKIQVYKGLNTLTNKVTQEESQGIRHHLLGFIDDPNADYNVTHFRNDAILAIESIIEQNKHPIIVGGSNSFIESLINGDSYFMSRYECCFLWVDVNLPVLDRFVSKRVDQMVESGLVDEVREIFDPEGDYTRGIRRAIGVPELDRFLRAEKDGFVDKGALDILLKIAIDEIKVNTYNLACRQVNKIRKMKDFWGWDLHHIDATDAFLKDKTEERNEAWERLVVRPSVLCVRDFLRATRSSGMQSKSKAPSTTVIKEVVSSMATVPAVI